MESFKKPVAFITLFVILILSVTSWYWSREPGFLTLDVTESPVIGVATTEMLIKSVETLVG